MEKKKHILKHCKVDIFHNNTNLKITECNK